jgi:hypothetical protein
MNRLTVLLVAFATLVGGMAFLATTSRYARAQAAAPIFRDQDSARIPRLEVGLGGPRRG